MATRQRQPVKSLKPDETESTIDGDRLERGALDLTAKLLQQRGSLRFKALLLRRTELE